MKIEDVKKSSYITLKDINTGEVKLVTIPSAVQVGLLDDRSSLSLGSLALGTRTIVVTEYDTTFSLDNDSTFVEVHDDRSTLTSSNPQITLPSSPYDGQLLIVKDASSTSETSNIQIAGNVEGSGSISIQKNRGSIGLYWGGSSWLRWFDNTTNISGSSVALIDQTVSSSFITTTNQASLLPNSRMLTSSAGVIVSDAGANSNVNLSLNITTSGSVTIATGSSNQLIIEGQALSTFPSIRYHTNKFNPIVMYQLSGSLADSGPNGRTLTVQNGAARYSSPYPGFLMFTFNNFTRLVHSTVRPELLISGSMTIEMIMCQNISDNNNFQCLLVCGGGATDANNNSNYLYRVGVAALQNLNYFAEFNSGVNISYDATGSVTMGTLTHLAMTRDATGQVQFYLNGEPMDAKSTGLSVPSGAATQAAALQILALGADFGNASVPGIGTAWYHGGIASLKIMTGSLTSGEVFNEFAYTLGGLYGIPVPAGY